MNQQTVYQKVSVHTPPDLNGEYFIVRNSASCPMATIDIDICNPVFDAATTHWLKPATGYFFTPEEFREVAEKLYDAGYIRGYDEVNVLKFGGHIFPDFQTFYNQLTESK